MTSFSSRIPGFYQQTLQERCAEIQKRVQTQEHHNLSKQLPTLSLEMANQMIENVIGLYHLPLAIATNFQINGKDYLIPMCIEEPSVVAAASRAALLVREGGGFWAEADSSVMISQIFITEIKNLQQTQQNILQNKEHLIQKANQAHPSLVKRGGGMKDVEVRVLSQDTLVVHLLIDCCDAMGANLVNGIAETLTPEIANMTNGTIGMRILSNLADRRCVRVHCKIPTLALTAQKYPGETFRDQIIVASHMAELDPYRAATHNKGIMNGVDAVTLATGNDWRGVEAGAHAFAARSGAYQPLSHWTKDPHGNLCGFLEMPMAVGTKGGTLSVHPGAQTSLQILGIEKARELGMVIAAVGLATNLAALRALAGTGIQTAHMPLHQRATKNLTR